MFDQELYDKIVARVNKDPFTGCWIWLGPGWYKRKSPGNRYGYIQVRISVGVWKTIGTHKAMWRAMHGAPDKGMCVCHKCDNPRCCNPEHLWLGTHLQNMADCRAKNRYHYANLTHCKHGHEFTPENTYHIKTPGPAFGLRACKLCMKLRAQTPEAKAKARERQRLRRLRMKASKQTPA